LQNWLQTKPWFIHWNKSLLEISFGLGEVPAGGAKSLGSPVPLLTPALGCSPRVPWPSGTNRVKKHILKNENLWDEKFLLPPSFPFPPQKFGLCRLLLTWEWVGGNCNQNLQIQAVVHCTSILTVRGVFNFAVTVASEIVKSQLKLLWKSGPFVLFFTRAVDSTMVQHPF